MRNKTSFAIILGLLSIPFVVIAQGGDIQITCESGLRIYLDGKFVGKSNSDEDGKYLMNVSSGRHTVVVRKTGFAPKEFEIQVNSGATEEIIVGKMIPEIKISQKYDFKSGDMKLRVGSLKITSAPLRCKIHFLNKSFNKKGNEVNIDNIPVGVHEIKIVRGNLIMYYSLKIIESETREIKADFLERKKIVDLTKQAEEAERRKIIEEAKRRENERIRAEQKKIEEQIRLEEKQRRKEEMIKAEAVRKAEEIEGKAIEIRKNLRSTFLIVKKVKHVYESLKKKGHFYTTRHSSGLAVVGTLYPFKKNPFKLKKINGDKVIVDSSTGLVWYEPKTPDLYRTKKINKWIANLNSRHYAGYTDWRLPTIEEALSLRITDNIPISDLFHLHFYLRHSRGRAVAILTGDKEHYLFKSHIYVQITEQTNYTKLYIRNYFFLPVRKDKN